MVADPNTAMEGKTQIRTKASGGSNLSEPNPLNRFATYTQIFTLSAVSREELYSLDYLKNPYKPHNIIAKTGGIAGAVNISQRGITLATGSAIAKETSSKGIAKNKDLFDLARSTLALGQDLFFESVNIDTVPIANDLRQMTSATRIEMEISEPLGLSLVTKMRAASNLAGHDTHITAPYLLTIEYQGFDENGNTRKLDAKYNRKIPVRISEMKVRVNQGGAVYSILAVPYNEFGFMDRFNKVTSDLNLESPGTLKEFCQNFTGALNDIVESEILQRLYSSDAKDLFLITCDPIFGEKKLLKGEQSLDSRPMSDVSNVNSTDTTQSTNDKDRYQNAKKAYKRIANIQKGTAITSVLREVMKLVNPYDSYDSLLKDWYVKANGALADTVDKWNHQEGDFQLGKYKDRLDYLKKNEDAFYVTMFKINTNVRNLKEFDYKTKDHRKIIHYHIEPYKVHILNFSQPGLGSNFDRYRNLAAQSNQFTARKIYSYIFTGENTEIMDLDLTYNVAHISPIYKSPDATRAQTVSSGAEAKDTGRDGNLNYHIEPDLPDLQYRVAQKGQATSGFVGQNPAFDLWVDGFNNPLADMVNVDLTVRGDPYYLSANQFNVMDTPIIATNSKGPGTFINSNRQERSADLDAYDEKTGSANLNIAEPYVALNYRFPVDIDLNTGEYMLDNGFRSPFNGAYRVTQIQSRFDRGQFTQVLKLVRFKNQGQKVDTPGSNQFTEGFKGTQPLQLKNFFKVFDKEFKLAETIAGAETIGGAIDTFLKYVSNRIKAKVNKIIGN